VLPLRKKEKLWRMVSLKVRPNGMLTGTLVAPLGGSAYETRGGVVSPAPVVRMVNSVCVYHITAPVQPG